MTACWVFIVLAVCLFQSSLGAKFDVFNPPTTAENAILSFQQRLLGLVRDSKLIRQADIKKNVNAWLESLDADSRGQYVFWLNELKDLDRVKANRIKNVMLNLSSESQRTLNRILMIHKKARLTQEEKRDQLKFAFESMKQHVREEITRNFQNSTSSTPQTWQ
ncbi:hypothetical protein L596_002273 [Steinernema carpocapsae]|uniref:SXP/RAL-2 family protein Ani s 5-like cation-binding domain-containing protein n=1 Tax=Steinernema carpocapsae TaxID=34508 RepID=A0A4V6I7E3_STECR|nr:hypothetical protein L596_002273 [Steinernema carpocapsae]